MDLKQENELTTNRMRIYRFPQTTVFLVLGGAISMAGSGVFPEGCYLRGMKSEDDKLLVCISHLSFEPIVDGNIPIFDLDASVEPPPPEPEKKSNLIIV